MNAIEQKAWDALDPLEKLNGLVDLLNRTQDQQKQTIAILKSRDQQIGVALDALQEIGRWHRMCRDRERMSCENPCYYAGDIAWKAVEQMRAIHKESLGAS